jgi:hypothetical protein
MLIDRLRQCIRNVTRHELGRWSILASQHHERYRPNRMAAFLILLDRQGTVENSHDHLGLLLGS